MNGIEKQLITHSRQQSFKTCRRKHWYEYEQRLRRITDAKALRIGSAFHAGIERLPNLEDACAAIRFDYNRVPDQLDAYGWGIECETILRLVCAYQWRWQDAGPEIVATEKSFRLPLANPATGAEAKFFDLAGKIDGIVRLEDGRLAVKETKTTSDNLDDDSDLWRRLRIDHQISMYIHAARKLGYPVDTVLYDVIRKPSIGPEAVPILDADGIKIVLDAAGNRVRNTSGAKAWRQTAERSLGYVLQTRPMTATEWGEKLSADIYARPNFYFARREVPRLDSDVAEYQAELWQIQQTIRETQRTGKWFRTVSMNTCPYCPFFNICSENQDVSDAAPPGFQFVENVHPELGEEIQCQPKPAKGVELPLCQNKAIPQEPIVPSHADLGTDKAWTSDLENQRFTLNNPLQWKEKKNGNRQAASEVASKADPGAAASEIASD